MNNILLVTDKLYRIWHIEFSDYTWKIFKGTDPKYIKNMLMEVCSEIYCNDDDFLMNQDTIVGYGLYLTMILLDYEDNGCVATVD